MNFKTKIYILSLVIVLLIVIVFYISLRRNDYAASTSGIGQDYTWHADFDAKGGNVISRGKKVGEIKNDIRKLVYALNRSDKDPETFRTPDDKEPIDPPKLKWVDIRDNVVNIEVINAEYLTQRMGSTGAEQFLAEATFTLTEYNNIRYVNFMFEEGDHASPGLYSRKLFIDERKWLIVE